MSADEYRQLVSKPNCTLTFIHMQPPLYLFGLQVYRYATKYGKIFERHVQAGGAEHWYLVTPHPPGPRQTGDSL